MENACETKESCFQKMTVRLKKYMPEIVGVVIGGIAGYIYYYKVGCATGSCPIKSNPWLMTFWGAAMGYLLVGLFNAKPKNKPKT